MLPTQTSNAAETIMSTLSARAVLDELPDAVLVTDAAGVVQYLNLTAVRWLGVSCDAARGRRADEILTVLDGTTREPSFEPLAHLLAHADARPTAHHDLLVRPDAPPMPIEYSIGSIRASARAPAGLVLMLRDARHGRMRDALHDAGRHDDRIRVLRRDEFEWRLARALEAMQDGDAHALLLIDVSGVGDAGVPGDLSERLYTQVREHDALACIAERQFALLLEHCPRTIARERAQALRATLAYHRAGDDEQPRVRGVSIGIAAVCNRPQTPRAVIAAAQTACARAGDPARIAEVVLE